MERHEMKARIDARMDEWKREIDKMKAKADSASGDAKVKYHEQAGSLEKHYNEQKIKAAAALDTADDKREEALKNLEHTWADWSDRAKKAWDNLKG